LIPHEFFDFLSQGDILFFERGIMARHCVCNIARTVQLALIEAKQNKNRNIRQGTKPLQESPATDFDGENLELVPQENQKRMIIMMTRGTS
jgi:hypothetical protein